MWLHFKIGLFELFSLHPLCELISSEGFPTSSILRMLAPSETTNTWDSFIGDWVTFRKHIKSPSPKLNGKGKRKVQKFTKIIKPPLMSQNDSIMYRNCASKNVYFHIESLLPTKKKLIL